MTKGTKRKDAATVTATTTAAAAVSRPTKRSKVSEQLDLEDLWNHLSPIGTEWDQIDSFSEHKWNFSNLEDAFEEGGILHGKKVYLFCCTEPQLLSFGDQSKITYIPVVIAVQSPFPPSDKIGIKSAYMVSEEIVDMKHMKMDWVPYIPSGKRGTSVKRFTSQIFILTCVQRRAGLKQLNEYRVKKFEYCLPYFYHPFKEDELEQSTEVNIIYPIEPNPVVCEFDWELDELEEFTDKLIKAEVLSEDDKDGFKEFVKEKVREGKRANREAKEKRRNAQKSMDKEAIDAFEKMKFYKFYPVPTPDTPDFIRSPFINRYYRYAHQVL